MSCRGKERLCGTTDASVRWSLCSGWVPRWSRRRQWHWRNLRIPSRRRAPQLRVGLRVGPIHRIQLPPEAPPRRVRVRLRGHRIVRILLHPRKIQRQPRVTLRLGSPQRRPTLARVPRKAPMQRTPPPLDPAPPSIPHRNPHRNRRAPTPVRRKPPHPTHRKRFRRRRPRQNHSRTSSPLQRPDTSPRPLRRFRRPRHRKQS